MCVYIIKDLLIKLVEFSLSLCNESEGFKIIILINFIWKNNYVHVR